MLQGLAVDLLNFPGGFAAGPPAGKLIGIERTDRSRGLPFRAPTVR